MIMRFEEVQNLLIASNYWSIVVFNRFLFKQTYTFLHSGSYGVSGKGIPFGWERSRNRIMKIGTFGMARDCIDVVKKIRVDMSSGTLNRAFKRPCWGPESRPTMWFPPRSFSEGIVGESWGFAVELG